MYKRRVAILATIFIVLLFILFALSSFQQTTNWSWQKGTSSDSPSFSPSNEEPVLESPSVSTSLPESPSPTLEAKSTPTPQSSPVAPKEVNYYLSKSQEEYKAGRKEEAIKTLEEALQYYPDNEIIKSRLDILKKGSFFGE